VNVCAASTTSSTRAPSRAALVVLLLLGFCAARAGADLVVLTDGAVLKVDRYEVQGDLVVLDLAAGGRLTLSIERIDRAIPDEIVAQQPEAVPPPPPEQFSLRFAAGSSQPDTPYGGPIWETSRRWGVNPSLVAAVAKVESRFNTRAVSSRGARGLMQLMPATGKRLGVQPAELFDPEKNLDAGARYLRELADRFGDDLSLVLAAYNAGEAAVAQYGGVPPYRETLAYLQRVYAVLGLATDDGV